jgi:Rrf2 family transcriptional regulator, cysteine metabolism repressor
MKISTKGRYGLRAMVDLTIHSVGEHVSLNSIADRQNVSENYLEQVFASLRKAGLVKSVKGAQGGYLLGEKPSKITVGDILRVLEGNLFVYDGDAGTSQPITGIEYCLNLNVWGKINESINAIVDSITLEDLANDFKKLSGSMSLMFYI